MPSENERVLVTGASGYIASYIVRDLLAEGYTVRGTVRDPNKVAELAHLRAMPGAPERLELVAADLLTPGAFDPHMSGCATVMHTASPYKLDVKDPQKDLVEPALLGTQNVLEAVARSSTVKRVVLTSSMAAITDEPDENHVLTEADWNTEFLDLILAARVVDGVDEAIAHIESHGSHHSDSIIISSCNVSLETRAGRNLVSRRRVSTRQ